MQLRIADFEDSVRLSEFYKEFPLEGWAKIKVDRKGQFFSPYEVQSDQFLTYVLSEKENEIHGVATFVIQNQGFQGLVQPIAWGRDLRIAQNRKAIFEWSNHFLPVMNEVTHAFGVKHIFTILNLNDAQLMNTFVRAHSLKRPLPRYHLYRRFNLITVHGKLPFVSNPLPHLRILRGTDEWLKPLSEYIIQRSKQFDLSLTWNEESFFERLARWKGLHIRDFYIAVDSQKNIVGCAAPWSPGKIQDLIPLEYSPPAHNFRQFLKFGGYFGWTHPLTKPVHRLEMEAPLNYRYLNFLHASNEDVFESLLFHIFDDLPKDEFIVYTQMRSDSAKRPPKGWICSESPHGVYALLAPDAPLPKYLHPTNDRPIEMEGFFVT